MARLLKTKQVSINKAIGKTIAKVIGVCDHVAILFDDGTFARFWIPEDDDEDFLPIDVGCDEGYHY